MFCNKCGEKLPVNTRYCHKCGNLVEPLASEPTKSNDSSNYAGYMNSQTKNYSPQPQKISNKVKAIIGGSVALVVVIVVVAIALSLNNSGNYDSYYSSGSSSSTTPSRSNRYDQILGVKSLIVFEATLDATYDDVVSAYITSPTWEKRVQSNSLTYVDISGRFNDVDGSSINVRLTIRVTPVEGREEDEVFLYEAYLLDLNGRYYGELAASEFVADLFGAYYEGYRSLAAFYQSYGFNDGIAYYYMANF